MSTSSVSALALCVFGIAASSLCSAPHAAAGAGIAAPAARPTIRFDRVMTIGINEGEESLVCTTDAILSAGPERRQFFLAPTCTAGEIAVLNESGALTRTIGNYGEGPGEMSDIMSLFVGPDELVHAFQFARRYTVFDSSGEFVATVDGARSVIWAVFLGNGLSIRNMRVPTPAAVGYPLHLLVREGSEERLVRSFGASDDSLVRNSDSVEMFRSVAVEPDAASVWSATYDEFILERWDVASGERLARIDRTPAWWAHDSTPGTVIADIDYRDGYVWILANVPTFTGELPDGVTVGDPILSEYFDSIIEVIDPQSEAVVAFARRDALLMRWLGDLVQHHVDPDADGVLQMDVWRVYLAPAVGFASEAAAVAINPQEEVR